MSLLKCRTESRSMLISMNLSHAWIMGPCFWSVLLLGSIFRNFIVLLLVPAWGGADSFCYFAPSPAGVSNCAASDFVALWSYWLSSAPQRWAVFNGLHPRIATSTRLNLFAHFNLQLDAAAYLRVGCFHDRVMLCIFLHFDCWAFAKLVWILVWSRQCEYLETLRLYRHE